MEYADTIKSALPAYRRYLNSQVFKTAGYLNNLRRAEDREGRSPFKIEPGSPEFDVPDDVEVYSALDMGISFLVAG